MPALGAAAWVGALAGLHLDSGIAAVTTAWWAAPAVVSVWWILRRRCAGRRTPAERRATGLAVLAWLILAAAVGGSAVLRDHAVESGAVARLAEHRAGVDGLIRITGDPRPVRGSFSDRVVVRAQLLEVTTVSGTWEVRSPVLVLAGTEWRKVRLGSLLRVRVRLSPGGSHDLAARLVPLGPPVLVAAPSTWWRGSAVVRAGVRDAVAGGAMPQRALVPALVDGDDQELPEDVQADFRSTGLTHLLAVSGTNLTLVVGFLVVVGRWCGVRRRWHYLVAVLGIIGFVLLARTEPSVVRAAAMGGAALIGLARNGTDRGLRALGVAVVGLLAWDPWLAVTVGFALSVLATAGILLLTPKWVASLSTWLPRWAAQAIAVPLAAQVACTPVVAAISGEVSLVAVLANLLAAPLVAPATVCGLLGGLLFLAWPWCGSLVGTVAVWAAAGIVQVAQRSASVNLPTVGWHTGVLALAVLTLLCLACLVLLGPVLRRPVPACALGALLVVVLLVPLPSPGWPPHGWLLVACDVGQGDALVLNAGNGSGVVVDVGPDPRAVDRCLRRLGIDEVPLIVLTHFHADHVDGLPGVLNGRRVGEVLVSALDDPVDAAGWVRRQARTRVPTYGETLQVGAVTLQVVAPRPEFVPGNPNDASLVLLAEVDDTRILLTGDVEPLSQGPLARDLVNLTVDVLKVPHHGSRHQDFDFLTGLRAQVAVISVGADNDYGHPAPETLSVLEGAGAEVLRTDEDGEVAVLRHGGQLRSLR